MNEITKVLIGVTFILFMLWLVLSIGFTIFYIDECNNNPKYDLPHRFVIGFNVVTIDYVLFSSCDYYIDGKWIQSLRVEEYVKNKQIEEYINREKKK